jgi:hypothetical protein
MNATLPSSVPVEVIAHLAEHRRDAWCGAVGLQRIRVGPLLDEHKRPICLVQRVELAARFLMYRFDGTFARIAHGVHGFGLGGKGRNDDDGHAAQLLR